MNIGIVGGGIMGQGIAQVAAQAGNKVVLYDNNVTALERAKTQTTDNLKKAVEKQKMTQSFANETLINIKWVDNLDNLADCDWVIEAIIEDITIKKSLFQSLEKIVSADCLLASNTSSLSITAIAGFCEKPKRVLGIHFFNPVSLMPLVEVIPAYQTEGSIPEKVVDELKKWHKIPVLAKDTPGFIVNRIARPYYSEALRILDEGLATIQEIDHAMTNLGNFKMGPFTLMDFIGHDVNFRVTDSMYQSCYHEARYKPSFSQKQLFDAGHWGRKTGKGFYNYPQNMVRTLHQAESMTEGVEKIDTDKMKSIFERIIVLLINEAADALYYKIADRNAIDLAMIKGVNYPKGLLAWADELGITFCVKKMDELYNFYHEERYRCSPLLRNKINETFY